MSELQYGRNCEILRLKRSGASYKKLAEDFGITQTRVRQICEETRTKQHQSPDDIPEILQAVKECGAPDRLYSLIIHKLFKHGYLRYNRWKNMSDEQIMELPYLGKKCIDIIQRAQEIAKG